MQNGSILAMIFPMQKRSILLNPSSCYLSIVHIPTFLPQIEMNPFGFYELIQMCVLWPVGLISREGEYLNTHISLLYANFLSL